MMAPEPPPWPPGPKIAMTDPLIFSMMAMRLASISANCGSKVCDLPGASPRVRATIRLADRVKAFALTDVEARFDMVMIGKDLNLATG